MILVDTSVWIDFFRGADSPERLILHKLIENEEDLSISEINLTECLQGVKNESEFRKLKGFLQEFPIYQPKGIETYVSAAQIYRRCRKKGKTVRRTIDCIIAAICIENDLILLHKDEDFDIIEQYTGLRLLNWVQ
jgi:hypothetical protein